MQDLEWLLAPADDGTGCGPDLSDDPDFLAMERAAQGTPAMRMGAAVNPGTPPDWRRVERLAGEMLTRSKDWRLAVLLLRAWWHQEGLEGLARGLRLVRALVERYGLTLYPEDTDGLPVGPLQDLGTLAVAELRRGLLGRPPDAMPVQDVERALRGRRAEPDAPDWEATCRALCQEEAQAPGLLARIEHCLAEAEAMRPVLAQLFYNDWRFPGGPLDQLRDALLSVRHAARLALAGLHPGPDAPCAPAAALAEAPLDRLTPPALEALLTPVAGGAPCGPDLGFDPRFNAMERAARGGAEAVYGDYTMPARPPDWDVVYDLARQLTAETKDLRVAVLLTRAMTRRLGLAGAVTGLRFIDGLLRQSWTALHPQLDPEDDDDPTERLNVLAALKARAALLGDLRAAVTPDGWPPSLVEAVSALQATLRALGLADIEDLAELALVVQTPTPAVAPASAPANDAPLPSVDHDAMLAVLSRLIGEAGLAADAAAGRAARLGLSEFAALLVAVTPDRAESAAAFLNREPAA